LGHSRAYERTHGWLTFSLDTKRFTPELWMLMGEARSKVEHIAGVPLRSSTSRELHVVYLAKGIHGTTAIEGNTLTEEQVRDHLGGGLRLPPSQAYLARELDNIVAAFNAARKLVLTGEAKLTASAICQLNGLILEGLELDDGVVAGQIRQHGAVVGPYLGAPAEDCDYLLRRMCGWLRGPEFEAVGWGVSLDILRAILAHLYIAWIHPFGDGNGRTARLIEAVILMARGVPTPAAQLLSNHYNATRTEYYRRLDEARRSPAHLVSFLTYAVRGFVDQLTQQIDVIRTQQHNQAWQDHVEGVFRSRSGPTAHRQRLIALELGTRKTAVRRADVPTLSAVIAATYSGKGTKTVTRDLNALRELGLIVLDIGGWRATTEIVTAFLPVRAEVGMLGGLTEQQQP
jgi:Fic family protein